jgi:hypothetical protein
VNPAREDDARRRRRAQRRLWLLAALFPAVLLAASALGALNIGLPDLLKLLTGSSDTPEVVRAVFWDIRMPRVLLAALVGASLALAGAGVQGLFRNPLADPALIGVSAGAALGAVLCFYFGWQGLLGGWLLPLAAFIGGWLAVLVLGLFNTGFAAGGTAKLILAGVALNAMIGSVLGFFLFSASDDALRSMTFWTLGSCASNSARSKRLTSGFRLRACAWKRSSPPRCSSARRRPLPAPSDSSASSHRTWRVCSSVACIVWSCPARFSSAACFSFSPISGRAPWLLRLSWRWVSSPRLSAVLSSSGSCAVHPRGPRHE